MKGRRAVRAHSERLNYVMIDNSYCWAINIPRNILSFVLLNPFHEALLQHFIRWGALISNLSLSQEGRRAKINAIKIINCSPITHILSSFWTYLLWFARNQVIWYNLTTPGCLHCQMYFMIIISFNVNTYKWIGKPNPGRFRAMPLGCHKESSDSTRSPIQLHWFHQLSLALCRGHLWFLSSVSVEREVNALTSREKTISSFE